MTKKIAFSKLPFVYELKSQPNNDEGITNFLPFNLVIDERYDLLKQEYNPEVDICLSKAYKISSILGGNTTEDEIGMGYAKSIMEFMQKNFSRSTTTQKVLDIGCGTGYLLSLLREKGFDVYGIEPGIQGSIGSKKYGLPILADFFPSQYLNQEFDVVISSLVLEHIINPEKFMIDIGKCLTRSGTVILGVPNTDPYVSSGDISTLFHEHWSYFTSKSFKNFLLKNAAINIVIEKSKYGGLLYAKFNFRNLSLVDDFVEIDDGEAVEYFTKIAVATEKLKKVFLSNINSNKSVGIYVPGRIINFLISESIELSNLRFFDDNVHTNNHYFPGIDIIVEDFQSFKNRPTDVLLIMSSVFGNVIQEKVLAYSSLKKENILTWNEIFE